MHRPQMSHIFYFCEKVRDCCSDGAGILSVIRNNGALNKLFVHSKYFPNSDWLKAHA